MAEYSQQIKAEIKRRGRITFAEYMDLLLYYLEYGYYMREETKIGTEGDFYTSPLVSVYFGQALAEQLAEVWDLLGKPISWQVVEAGAGTGKLAQDILTTLELKHPQAYQALEYYLWEKSPAMRKLQQEKILEKGQWIADITEVPGFRGVIFSNELLDAFPVHRLCWQGQNWQESYVQLVGEELQESWGELSRPDLLQYWPIESEEIEEGQIIEVNQAAQEWLKKVAESLEQGVILTIDYGGKAWDLYNPARLQGSLRGYYRHQLVDNFWENPGGFDLTAHVDFSYLSQAGQELGLKIAGYRNQTRFLLNLGILEMLQELPEEERLKATLLVKKLILPEGMGSLFKVLALTKNFPGVLRGLA